MHVSEITEQQLQLIAQKIVAFYEITFFAERDIEESTGLCLILEYIAIDIGLLNIEATEDSTEIMVAFVEKLDNFAIKENIKYWELYISPSLPFKQL